jgi:hypothetical protein
MGYSILSVRTREETDGRLYPVVADKPELIATEERDGEIQRLSASRMTVRELVGGSCKTIVQIKDTKVDLLVTESRFVIACEKFEKGGGWVGFGGAGLAFALAANGVSKLRAAQRRHGKLLVGQVRYPWLRCVGFTPRAGWGSQEQIRLGVVEMLGGGASRELFLDVSLPKNVDSGEVARVIAQKTARYRLEHVAIEDASEQACYEDLASAGRLASPAPKKFAFYQMPRWYCVSAQSANPVEEHRQVRAA